MRASASTARATRGAARVAASLVGGAHSAPARATAAPHHAATHRQARACATQAGGAAAATISAPATRRRASNRAAAASAASARSARAASATASAFAAAATLWTARAPASRATAASTAGSRALPASTAWAAVAGKREPSARGVGERGRRTRKGGQPKGTEMRGFGPRLASRPFSRCGQCKGQQPCTVAEGRCLTCEPGWNGTKCDQPCATGFYGEGCGHRCPPCRDGHACNHVTGKCTRCNAGWIGDR